MFDKINKIRQYKEMMLFFTRDERIDEKVLPAETITREAIDKIQFPDYAGTKVNLFI